MSRKSWRVIGVTAGFEYVIYSLYTSPVRGSTSLLAPSFSGLYDRCEEAPSWARFLRGSIVSYVPSRYSFTPCPSRRSVSSTLSALLSSIHSILPSLPLSRNLSALDESITPLYDFSSFFSVFASFGHLNLRLLQTPMSRGLSATWINRYFLEIPSQSPHQRFHHDNNIHQIITRSKIHSRIYSFFLLKRLLEG